MTDLSVIRGDDETIDLTITDDEGDPVDLTGVSLWMTVKSNPADADALAIFQKTIGDGITVTSTSDGTATINIEDDDTSPLPAPWSGYYDVQLGSSGVIKTIASGAFAVTADITRTTS